MSERMGAGGKAALRRAGGGGVEEGEAEAGSATALHQQPPQLAARGGRGRTWRRRRLPWPPDLEGG